MPTGPGLVKQKGTEHQNTVITLRASETILLASVKDLSIISLLNIQSNTWYCLLRDLQFKPEKIYRLTEKAVLGKSQQELQQESI